MPVARDRILAGRRTARSRASELRRYRHVVAFVRGRLGGVRHELRVARLCGELFRRTRAWHGLSETHLRALRLAALLHDIGRAMDDARHPQLGAELIARSRKLPLSAGERRLATFMARYHRGAVPRAGHDDVLRKGEHATAERLLALLRAADGLDSRSAGGAGVRFAVREKPDGVRRLEVTITPHVVSARSLKALGRRKKFRLLEETLGCEVRVRFG